MSGAEPEQTGEIMIVTGMSGAGRSTAASSATATDNI